MDLQAARTVVCCADGVDQASLALLGGKAFHLHLLEKAGFSVPSWFVLSTSAFEAFLTRHGKTIQNHLASLDYSDPAQVIRTSRLLTELLMGIEFEPEQSEEIRAAYRKFFSQGFVAVRSSAVGEDSKENSFAGQLDTFLFVKGETELFRAIRACWASAYSERSLIYRHQNRLSFDIRVAVVVQEMVQGDVSGVLFSANPINGKRNESVVSATYGLGEGLVSGELDADNWVVDRRSRLIQSSIVTKTEQIVCNASLGSGTIKVAVPADCQNEPCLLESQLWEVVNLGERLAEHFGAPQDIEWTLSEGTVVLLQTRPITALPESGKSNLFDNSNVCENYAGVTTPLTFTFSLRVYELAYIHMAEAMGFSPIDIKRCSPLFKNMLALIQGRVFYNLGNWYELMAHLPGYPFLRRVFALSIGARSSEGGPDKEKGSGVWQLLRVARRIIFHLVRWDKEVEKFETSFERAYERVRKRPFSGLTIDELADAYIAFEGELWLFWTEPMINDLFAMSFYGFLKQMIVRWQLDEEGSLQNDLLCGEGGIVSTEPTRAILNLARYAWSRPSLRALIEAEPKEVYGRLQETDDEFFALVQDYLQNYGSRCIGELRLEAVPLTEDPSFLFSTLANYLRAGDRDGEDVLDFGRIEAREKGIRNRAEAQVRARLMKRPLRRAWFSLVLKGARKAVKNRENMRFCRTKVFGVVREIFAAIGCKMVERGILDQGRDIYSLNLDEILAWVQGRATNTELRPLVTLRKNEFSRFLQESPDDRFETQGPVYLNNAFRTGAATKVEAGVLHGTSCCPGKVNGIARVILPGGPMRLNGEILVAERTDPGWVPLYPSASALLIERGSLLSHAAIVAREMGLPTIVGIADLIKRVRDGQYLEVDAREGLVFLDREQPPAGRTV